MAGYSVIFTTAAELIERLQGDLSPSTFRRKLARYANCQLLCIDEVGYLAYDAHAADLLYKVVDRRYERASILLTTNLAFTGLPHPPRCGQVARAGCVVNGLRRSPGGRRQFG